MVSSGSDSDREERSDRREKDRRRDRDRDRDRTRDHRGGDRDRGGGDRDRDYRRDRRQFPSRHGSGRDRYSSDNHRSSSRRDRSDSRSKSRSRSPRRGKKDSKFDGSSSTPAASAPSAVNTQQQALLLQQQQQLLAQQWIQQQMAAAAAATPAINKKQRELYVGNLTVGLVTPQMLQELFNGALIPLLSDGATNPPCTNVSMDGSLKFAFAEFRTEELATMGLHLDKVELCGRNINVGRPGGYVDPKTPGYVPGQPVNPTMMVTAGGSNAYLGAANPLLAPQAPATNCLYLSNLCQSAELLDEDERGEIAEEVKDECNKRGAVIDVTVPKPPDTAVEQKEPGRVYVKFVEQAGAIAAQRALNGRTFGGNKVVAAFVPEYEFEQAKTGAWLPPPATPAPVEGVLKMRGLPFTATKQDIVLFFQGNGVKEEDVNIVYGRDGRPTGEAYCVFEGPDSDIRGALSKHRQVLGTRYVELFPTTRAEMDQCRAAGVYMG